MTITAEHAPVPATGPAPGSATTELRALTGLRIVAAAWVVLFHFHFTALPGVALVVAALGPVVTSGALGVDLFFVLSGFVIAYTYLEKLGPKMTAEQTGRFVWARACRIWPAYALVFHMFGIWLVARAVYGSDPDIAFQATQPTLSAGEWVEQLFMVQLWDQPYFDGASWVGSTWSISAEWLAYLLFPGVALVFHRMRNLPFVVLAGGAVALMAPIAVAYLQTGSPYYPWSWLVRILCGFGGGILAYLAVRKLRATDARVRRGASWVATATPVAIVAGLMAGELVGPGRGGAVILLFPLLVGSLALADGGAARWLSTPAMVLGGRISYALYLIHIPMFEVYWLAMAYLPELVGSTVLAHLAGLSMLVATVPAAWLLYRWVEEPARVAMKKVPEFLHLPFPAAPAKHEPALELLSAGPITPPPEPTPPADPNVRAVPSA
ncbi:acyltransferase family protein [Pseudonocardia pini]|uniref:acyltransferase family protein n=1 Tax=Pseudonocardia pini TaxID=2758030 RepID=UPI0015F0DCA1|nr:acyltransferase [Pseudonocardia pini]